MVIFKKSKLFPQKQDSENNKSSSPTSFDFELNKKAAFWLYEFWEPKIKGLNRRRIDLEVIQPKEDHMYIVYDDKRKQSNMWVRKITYDCSHSEFKRICTLMLLEGEIIKWNS
jgi:hypothetical protein